LRFHIGAARFGRESRVAGRNPGPRARVPSDLMSAVLEIRFKDRGVSPIKGRAEDGVCNRGPEQLGVPASSGTPGFYDRFFGYFRMDVSARRRRRGSQMTSSNPQSQARFHSLPAQPCINRARENSLGVPTVEQNHPARRPPALRCSCSPSAAPTKTLVFCSEGSPEKLLSAVSNNDRHTSFDGQ